MSEFSLKRMASLADPLADAVALRIDRRRPSVMMAEVHYLAKTEIGPYQELMDHLYDVPRWVDWALIEQGQKLQAAFLHTRLLAMLSGGLIEIFCVSQVSKRLVERNHCHLEVVRRLHETQQLLRSINEPNCLRPGNSMHRILSEIRLSNAMLRKSLVAKDWHKQHHQPPFNQRDMIFDILNFGQGTTDNLTKLGLTLNTEDQLALHHFWRYAGYLYGIEENFLGRSVDADKRMILQCKKVAVEPNSPEKRQLAQTTLRLISEQTAINFPLGLLQAISRICLGSNKANALNIPNQPSWQRAVSLFSTTNRGSYFAYQHIPGFTSVNIKLNELFVTFLQNTQTERSRPAQNIA